MPMQAVIFDWGDTVMRDFAEYAGAMVTWPRVEAIPGVQAALEQLSGRYICVLASNAGASDAALMGQALERVGLRRYFRHLFTSKELGAVKPQPAFFLGVARQIGVPPEACIMVGNDLVKDIGGAKSCGMRTVWLSAAGAGGPEADRIITTMTELPAAVRSIDLEALPHA
jgi:putative hydrolase of the HAD superfamily